MIMKKIITLLFLIIIFLSESGFTQTWESIGALGPTGNVKAIAESPTHEIYAGGAFTGSGNFYLAVWSGGSWNQLGSGINGPVFALVFIDNDLYIGGSFNLANGIAVNNIVKYNVVTNVWSDVGGGFNGQVKCFYVDTNNILYAGGAFSQSGVNTMNHISKLESGTWTPVDSGINSVVNAITEYSGSLWAGTENVSTPLYKNGVNGWNPDTIIKNGRVYALAEFSNNLYVGGDFSIPAIAAARFDGTNWGTIQTTFLPGDKIYALSPRSDIVLYIAGKFLNKGVPGFEADYIARINSPTTPLKSITVSSSKINGEVYAIGNQGGKVIAGGQFSSPASNIAITSTTINIDELSGLIVNKSFYPNPVSNKAYLNIRTKEHLKNPELKFYDMQSQLLRELNIDRRLNNKEVEFTIDCAELAPGNYFYTVSDNDKIITSDIFIVK
jgi:hypothetical protein